MDNRTLIKIVVLSLILGAIFAILAPIPYLGIVILFIALILAAPAVMLYMIMDGSYDLTTTKDSIINGAISGFCVNLSFSIVYCIIITILAKGFSIADNAFLTYMIINSPIWLLIAFIIFIGVLFATTNAFSAFLTHYIIDFIRDNYENSHKNS